MTKKAKKKTASSDSSEDSSEEEEKGQEPPAKKAGKAGQRVGLNSFRKISCSLPVLTRWLVFPGTYFVQLYLPSGPVCPSIP